LSVFSQNVTTTVEYINIPVLTAKKIAVDLLKGDSAVSQLQFANLTIGKQSEKIEVQKQIIDRLEQKDQNNQIIVTELNKKVTIFEKELLITQKELRKVKAKKTFTNLIMGGIVGVMTYLYITK
jgi:hypothetical protein